MEHRFLKVHQLDKAKVCAVIVAGATKALCFCRTKRGADRLVDDLRREGVRVAAIHGDLGSQPGEKALDDFASGKLPALVATDVAGSGSRYRRSRRRGPLRPARGPQGLPASVRPDSKSRRGRCGRDAGPLGPGACRGTSTAAHRPSSADRGGLLKRPASLAKLADWSPKPIQRDRRAPCTSASYWQAAISRATIPWPAEMVNLVYLIGDRASGEAVAVDPAYAA